MQVQVHTDNHIQGSVELKQHVAETLNDALARFGDRITRVEAHLADVNSSAKGGGDDIRCSLEARPASMSPIVVTHNAATVDQALSGAVDKLQQTLERTFDRRDDPKGRTSFAG
jgi:ribosome-associated translation inhibitor RaiA